MTAISSARYVFVCRCRCLVGSWDAFQAQHHGGAINDIRSTSDGRVFASASADGSISMWDAVSCRLINRLPKAGHELGSRHAHRRHSHLCCAFLVSLKRCEAFEVRLSHDMARVPHTHVVRLTLQPTSRHQSPEGTYPLCCCCWCGLHVQ